MSTVRWPRRAVLADPADGGRERLREDEVAEHLGGVRLELRGVGALVAAVEVAQEVAAVAPVERRAAPAPRASVWSTKRTRSSGGRRRVASHEYDATTFDAISVFSRSKAAKCRAGSSTWRRRRSSRFSPCRPPGVVRTRACSTTDGRCTLGA